MIRLAAIGLLACGFAFSCWVGIRMERKRQKDEQAPCECEFCEKTTPLPARREVSEDRKAAQMAKSGAAIHASRLMVGTHRGSQR